MGRNETRTTIQQQIRFVPRNLRGRQRASAHAKGETALDDGCDASSSGADSGAPHLP